MWFPFLFFFFCCLLLLIVTYFAYIFRVLCSMCPMSIESFIFIFFFLFGCVFSMLLPLLYVFFWLWLLLLLLLLSYCFVLFCLHYNTLKCTKPWKTLKHHMLCYCILMYEKQKLYILFHRLFWRFQCVVCVCVFWVILFYCEFCPPNGVVVVFLANITAIWIHNCGCVTIASALCFCLLFQRTENATTHTHFYMCTDKKKKERKINGLFI